MEFFKRVLNKLKTGIGSNRLGVILGVFEVAKEDLDDYIKDQSLHVDQLNSQLVQASKDQKRATAAREQIKKILGE